MLELEKKISSLKEQMIAENVRPQNGMPEELFLFSTTLSPVVNVDLLITNENHQILLTWREDIHNGSGWHVPGGCIRFRETMEERIQACATSELDTKVVFDSIPIAVMENIIDYPRPIVDQNERAHFITICFRCFLPEKFELEDNMKWFDELPNDLLRTQAAYRKHWCEISKKL